MIPGEEIGEHARRYGVPLSSIERDYAQSWLLEHLSNNFEMVFKGGTCIRKLHINNYRFSDDLDFTLLDEYTKENIEEKIKDAVKIAKSVSGISYEQSIRVKEVTNGFRATIGFRILNIHGNPINIKLDLTKKENEKVLIQPRKYAIIHPYSDNLDAKIKSYTLSEILAEKIRSLFQRTRPRDLYDVWRLSKHELNVTNILRDKFDFKEINLDLTDLESRKNVYENSWESSLKHQIGDVPDCNFVYSEVIDYLKSFVYLFN